MQSIRLEAIECPVTGETGFAIQGAAIAEDYLAATSGQLVAHDLIEHQNGPDEIGSVGDELEALGAVWYVRGHEGIEYDIARMAEDHRYKGFARDIPDAMPCDADDSFAWILRDARKGARADFKYGKPDSRAEQAECLLEMRAYFRSALPFLRTGYHKAEARFGARHVAASQFNAIAAAVDSVVRGLEVGQVFELTWDESRASIEEFYGEDFPDESEE